MKLLLKYEYKHFETSSDLTKYQSLSRHLTAGEVTVMLCSCHCSEVQLMSEFKHCTNQRTVVKSSSYCLWILIFCSESMPGSVCSNCLDYLTQTPGSPKLQLNSQEADLDRTVNALRFPDKAPTFPRDRGDHARLFSSDKSHRHSGLDDKDEYNAAYVKRKTSDTRTSPVNKSTVQPSLGTFIIINLTDIFRRQRLPLLGAFSVFAPWITLLLICAMEIYQLPCSVNLKLGQESARCENHIVKPQRWRSHTEEETPHVIHTSTHTVHVWERVKSGRPLLSGSTGSSRQYRGFMPGSAPNCSLQAGPAPD